MQITNIATDIKTLISSAKTKAINAVDTQSITMGAGTFIG